MPVHYPYALPNLDGSGAVPTDGEPVRAVHFNKLFREITAVESALGEGNALKGNLTDLKSRLAVRMNSDGTWKRELVCDDDPSGQSYGASRFLNFASEDARLDNPFTQWEDKVFIPLSYSHWDEPPAFFFTWGSDSGAWFPHAERRIILAASEVGVRVSFRLRTGEPPQATEHGEVHWFAISKDFTVWEDDRAWAMRPVRAGS